jgi:hypothetical protein
MIIKVHNMNQTNKIKIKTIYKIKTINTIKIKIK